MHAILLMRVKKYQKKIMGNKILPRGRLDFAHTKKR